MLRDITRKRGGKAQKIDGGFDLIDLPHGAMLTQVSRSVEYDLGRWSVLHALSSVCESRRSSIGLASFALRLA